MAHVLGSLRRSLTVSFPASLTTSAVRQQAYAALSDFLDQMLKQPVPSPPALEAAAIEEAAGRGRWGSMAAVLIAQSARGKDKFNRVTAVEWLTQFVGLAGPLLAPMYPQARRCPALCRWRAS